MTKALLILISLLFGAIILTAGNTGSYGHAFWNELPQKVVTAYKVKDLEIKLDGKLTEPIWQESPIKDFTQRDPNEGTTPSEETHVWVAYDNSHLYVAAQLNDTKPESIDASLARRDAQIESDWFIFFVDPYNDKKTGYYFAVNAGGTLSDGVLFNDSWDDNTWDGIWEAKTSIDDKGWTVEMRIPFSQLRFNEGDKMTWGINFERDIKRNKERIFFMMVPKKESGFVSRFAALGGLNGIKPKQRFELLPYAVQKAQYLKHDPEDPFYKSNQYKTSFGADLKIGIGSNINIDASLNPDFGQVEVDPAVINLSAFESYFQEKRPFFIEGFNMFYFGIGGANNNWGFNFNWPELFYSRRIGRRPQGTVSSAQFVNYPSVSKIIGAAKLTGKLDETTTVGAVSAVTERTYATLYNNAIRTSEEVEPLTHYGVFRAKREFNNGNQSFGVMFTAVNRDLSGSNLKPLLAKNAFTFGFDGYTFLDEGKEYVISSAFAGSYIHGTKEFLLRLQKQSYRYFQRPDARYAVLDSNRTSLTGLYGRIMLNKQSGNFYINAALGAVSPGFEFNDLGFQWIADRINGHLVLGYRWFDPDGTFRRKQIYLSHARSYDFEGNSTSKFIWVNTNFMFMNYWGVQLGGVYSFESLNKTATRGGPLVKQPEEYSINLSSYTDSREKIIVEAYTGYSKSKLGGSYSSLGIDIIWRPNTQINVSIGPQFERNKNPYQWVGNFSDTTAVNTLGARYIFARIDQTTLAANIRLNWTFTPKLSLQLFFQPLFAVGKYNDFKELARPKTSDANEYGKNGSTIIFDASADVYNVDPDGDGPAQTFQISNPDFNFKSLRGNVVLRWEVLPGSILYFAWSRNQTNFQDPGDFNLSRDFKNLWETEGDDIFLVKFSYWFNI